MKKIALALSAILLMALFASCGTKAPSSSASASANLEGSLTDIMAKLYDGVTAEMPAVADREITPEFSMNDLGVESTEYKEALASDALINASAHSVCLVRANSAAEAETLEKTIREKANPRKWICVEAEKVIVDRIGDVVVLIMTYEDVADQVHANFTKLAK